ncbi:hypothetical protein WN55_02208 [Dufourea novaeangliae]|uniref:Uncharacterized protein n=1 Tax=Dufourea novaeangliae TaxID=178035 RepID=A0A154PHP8_DUFNO|nr:hypothetical protein WN55_02208 [Dufourea novaeangliae]
MEANNFPRSNESVAHLYVRLQVVTKVIPIQVSFKCWGQHDLQVVETNNY